ncbi:MAG: hypothetical protein Q9173_004395, partial [Seirophora scorigena]
MASTQPDTEASLRDILSLDKSTAPLTTQIDEAFDILRISTVHTRKVNNAREGCSGQHGPREEWTLRWLLKKLEETGPEAKSVYLESKVWSLILELVLRLRVPNLARLLRTYNFINILANALRIVEDTLRDGNHALPSSPKSASSASSDPSGAMRSSSATVEARIVSAITSRKRKRDGSWVDQDPGTAAHMVNIELVFCRIGAVLVELQELMDVDSSGYASEQLKMAFRVFPDQAAEILGRSHNITNLLLRTHRDALVAESLAFASACFIPTLELLGSLDDNPDSVKDASETIATLQRQITEHIVLPARQSFEKSKSRTAKGDGEREISIDQLLSPLRGIVSQREHQHKFHIEKFHPIARFYRIVVEDTPLETSKQRISERAWLQFMFDHIATQASIFVSNSSDFTSNPDSTKALKDILGIVSDQNIKFETASLEKILTQCSLLLNKESSLMDWDIITLCVAIDPDVFVIPAVSKATADLPARKPNTYLIALFRKINALSQSAQAKSKQSRSMRQAELITVSLVEGFAHARDLLGFIDHWTSNLVHAQSLRNDAEDQTVNLDGQTDDPDDQIGDSGEQTDENSINSPRRSRANKGSSVWEGDLLSQAVATEVEPRLTIGQIENLLQKSKVGLRAMNTDSDREQGRYVADLVILDCILSGCHNEDNIEQLTEIVKDLYTIILASLEAEVPPKFHTWRLWRCMATIKSRWVIQLNRSINFSESEENIVKKALEQLSNLNEGHSMEELLQSLNYVLSVIESPGLPLRNRFACSTIKAITDALKHYREQINSQYENDCMDFDPSTRTEKQVAHIKNLVQRYASQLCLRPATLRLSTPELQTAFFEWLFEIGQWVRGTEPGPWEDLLHSEALEEDQALAKNFRLFLVETFHDAHPNIDADKKYQLIFDSIHKTPVHRLDRKQRAKIFNRILEILLEGAHLTLQEVKDHLKLMIDYLAHPSKFINLVQHSSGLANHSGEIGHKSSALVRLANILKSIDDQDNEAVYLMKLLTRKVLECQLWKDDKTQVFSYLDAHYQALRFAQNREEFCNDEFSLMLVAVSLDFYQLHLNDFPAQLQHPGGDVSNFRRVVLAITKKATSPILSRTRRPDASDTAHYCAGVVLRSYPLYTNMYREAEIQKFKHDIQILEDEVNKFVSRRRERFQSEKGTIAKLLVDASREEHGVVGSAKAIDLLERYQTSDAILSVQEQREHVSRVLRFSEGLGPDDKANTMTALTSQMNEGLPDRASLLLLQGLIMSYYGADTHDEGTSTALSLVVNHLSDGLFEPQRFESIVLSLQSIDLILQKHPHTITQYNIDQIMAVITTCASQRSSQCTLKQTSLQYLALCRLFSTILAFHRRRLGGRYHLIIPTVQSLLRPLFIPFTSSANPTYSNLFTAAHASAYSSILHQLADPSLPSLTPHHSRRKQDRHNLNDVTKTAKSIAGQYLHYLVMTYCECQLKGRLEKDVREKLKPGLWVVLDVIPQEQMRTESAKMSEPPIVLDGGTGFLKVGYAAQNFPEHQYPSIVGRPILRSEERSGDIVVKDIMCGDEAAAARSMLQITYPMENGIVKRWDDMEHLWNYTFNEKMQIDTTGRKILLTEPPMNPLKNREQMCERMFETYNFGGVYVAIQAVLALYAQGLSSGVVVDSGDGVTHIVPVYESTVLTHHTKRLDVAGRDVTRNLIALLLRRGYALNRTADFETVRQIKEKLCYVSYDLELDQRLSEDTTVLVESYTLPDGRVIRVGSERFEAPECLFQPHLVDVEQPGISEFLFNTIQGTDVDVRSSLYKAIVLSGGSSMYPGLPSRLEKELKQLWLTKVLGGNPERLNKFKVRIEDPPRRRHMVFLGGAVLANI